MEDLLNTLDSMGIAPLEGDIRSTVYTEYHLEIGDALQVYSFKGKEKTRGLHS